MQKGDLVVPQFSRTQMQHPNSKDDAKKYGRAGFPNSNMGNHSFFIPWKKIETPKNIQAYVYSPILSKRAGFLGGFMPFSRTNPPSPLNPIASNPNTGTAGKKCGFTINPTNPLVNPQAVTNRMDKSIINLKQNISKGNK